MDATCFCPRCAGTAFDPGPVIAQIACTYCLGRGRIEDIHLSPHFQFSELVRAHPGWPNAPSKAALERLRSLCTDLLEPVREKVGPLLVTSGYRAPAYDAHVAGPPFENRLSGHSIGAAADVRPTSPGASLRDVMEAAADLPHDQRILEGRCVHLALFAPYPVDADIQRRQALVRLLNPGVADDQRAPRYIYARWNPSDPDQLLRAV